MKKINILLLALLLISQVHSKKSLKKHQISKHTLTTDYCPEPVYRSDGEVEEMAAQIDDAFSSQRMDILQEYAEKNSRVYSTDQILQILNAMNFVSLKIQAINYLQNYITFFSTDELIKMLENVTFTDDQINLLETVAPFLSDINEENLQKIYDCLIFDSTIEKAKEILANIKPRDCLFGSITEKTAVFAIDISGSMGQGFSLPEGGSITRLDFVKQHLIKTLATQLQDYQNFNIVRFSSYSSRLFNTVVPATQDNISKAINYISHFNPGGGTNLSDPILNGKKYVSELNSIYLLTDGSPNYGITTSSGMADFIDNIKDTSPDLQINTISFMLGGTESTSARQHSTEFMELIATQSGGSFRQMQAE